MTMHLGNNDRNWRDNGVRFGLVAEIVAVLFLIIYMLLSTSLFDRIPFISLIGTPLKVVRVIAIILVNGLVGWIVVSDYWYHYVDLDYINILSFIGKLFLSSLIIAGITSLLFFITPRTTPINIFANIIVMILQRIIFNFRRIH